MVSGELEAAIKMHVLQIVMLHGIWFYLYDGSCLSSVGKSDCLLQSLQNTLYLFTC